MCDANCYSRAGLWLGAGLPHAFGAADCKAGSDLTLGAVCVSQRGQVCKLTACTQLAGLVDHMGACMAMLFQNSNYQQRAAGWARHSWEQRQAAAASHKGLRSGAAAPAADWRKASSCFSCCSCTALPMSSSRSSWLAQPRGRPTNRRPIADCGSRHQLGCEWRCPRMLSGGWHQSVLDTRQPCSWDPCRQ